MTMLNLVLAVATLYLGDENAIRPDADAANSRTVSFAGATTDALLEKIDAGALKGIEADAIELFIGANNTRTRPYAEETPLDTVLGAKDVSVRLRALYPQATIALNPIPYAATDSLENRLRNFEVNRACIEINDGGGGKMFMRQPDWMFRRPAPSKWKADCPPTTPYIKKYWLDNLKDPRLRLKREEQRARAVKVWDCVMLGDSVTHFWELHNGTPYFNANLRDRWSIFNLGFGGDATQNTIWNLLNAGYTDGCKVKLFTILIGNNNINDGTTEAQLADVAKACGQIVAIVREQHPEARIVLFPLLPNGTRTDSARSRLHGRYNEMIRRFADGKTVIWAQELWERFQSPDGSISRERLCDGCHPGKEGYRIWGEILKSYLEKYCGNGKSR